MTADSDASASHYLDLARHDWIFCLEPGESITEGLQASLFEWSALPSHNGASSVAGGSAFSVFVREQTGEGLAGASCARNPSCPPQLDPLARTAPRS